MFKPRRSTILLIGIITAVWLACQCLLYVAYDRAWGQGFVEEYGLLIFLFPGIFANVFLDSLLHPDHSTWSWVNVMVVLLVSTVVWTGLTILLVLPVNRLMRRARKGHAA